MIDCRAGIVTRRTFAPIEHHGRIAMVCVGGRAGQHGYVSRPDGSHLVAVAGLNCDPYPIGGRYLMCLQDSVITDRVSSPTVVIVDTVTWTAGAVGESAYGRAGDMLLLPGVHGDIYPTTSFFIACTSNGCGW
jgi:hypothetical protein